MSPDTYKYNKGLALNLRNCANLYINGNDQTDFDKLHTQMTILLPRTSDATGHVTLKSHPADSDTNIRELIDGPDFTLAIILTGALHALAQITENGLVEIPVKLAIDSANYTSDRLKRGHAKDIDAGTYWAYGFRDVCNQIIDG